MRTCIDHPRQKGGKICKVIGAEGMSFEIYNEDKLVEKIWMTSEWDDYPIDESNSIIRKDKIEELLKFFEEENMKKDK